jgi:hypothetical protein
MNLRCNGLLKGHTKENLKQNNRRWTQIYTDRSETISARPDDQPSANHSITPWADLQLPLRQTIVGAPGSHSFKTIRKSVLKGLAETFPSSGGLVLDWGRRQDYPRESAFICGCIVPRLRYAALSKLRSLSWLFDTSGAGNSFLTMGATRVPRSSIARIVFRCPIIPPFNKIVNRLIPPKTLFS